MVRDRMELNGGARDVAINYVTFRLDVLTWVVSRSPRDHVFKFANISRP